MASKKNMRITYPASEKIYIPGEINKIKVGMRKIKLLDTGAIAFLRSVKQEFNGPVRCTILQNGGHSFQNCTEAGYIVCAEDCRPV